MFAQFTYFKHCREINGKQYKSFIKERKIANETYTNAQKSGNTAGIVNKNEYEFFLLKITC